MQLSVILCLQLACTSPGYNHAVAWRPPLQYSEGLEEDKEMFVVH